MSLSKPVVHSMLVIGPVCKDPAIYAHPCVRHIPNTMNCIITVGSTDSPYTLIDGPRSGTETHHISAKGSEMIADICSGTIFARYTKRIHVMRRETPLPKRCTMADILMMKSKDCYIHVDVGGNHVFNPNPGDVILFDCHGLPLHHVNRNSIGQYPLTMRHGYEAIICLPEINDTDRFQREVLMNPVVLRQARQHIDHLFECFDVEWDTASNGLKVNWNAERNRAAKDYPELQALRQFNLSTAPERKRKAT